MIEKKANDDKLNSDLLIIERDFKIIFNLIAGHYALCARWSNCEINTIFMLLDECRLQARNTLDGVRSLTLNQYRKGEKKPTKTETNV